VVQAVATVGRLAGFRVQITSGKLPTRRRFQPANGGDTVPTGQDNVVDASTVDIKSPDANTGLAEIPAGKVPDVIFIDSVQTIVMDIAVVHPGAKSHTGQSVSRPGSAANNKAR